MNKTQQVAFFYRTIKQENNMSQTCMCIEEFWRLRDGMKKKDNSLCYKVVFAWWLTPYGILKMTSVYTIREKSAMFTFRILFITLMIEIVIDKV